VTAVGVPSVAALWTGVWKTLARPGPPTLEDFAVAIELLVAAIALQLSELGYSVANHEPGKFIGLKGGIAFGLVSIVLPVFALWIRFSYQTGAGEWTLNLSVAKRSSLLAFAILGGTFLVNYFSGPVLS
jgi:hypothetical protein